MFNHCKINVICESSVNSKCEVVSAYVILGVHCIALIVCSFLKKVGKGRREDENKLNGEECIYTHSHRSCPRQL